MSSDITKSQEIHVTGGFVLPRRLGLGALWALAGLVITLSAYGVRAEGRLQTLEANQPRDRLERIERVLCLICMRDAQTADPCKAVCDVEVKR